MTLAADAHLTRDDYLTRVSGAPVIVDRPDPVVWTEVDDPEVRDFAERGYIQRESALDDARIDACLEELRRIGDDPAMADDPRIIRERIERLVFVKEVVQERRYRPAERRASEDQLVVAPRHANRFVRVSRFDGFEVEPVATTEFVRHVRLQSGLVHQRVHFCHDNVTHYCCTV